MNLLRIISLGILLLYMLRILSYRIGWGRTARGPGIRYNPGYSEQWPGLSLVVPVRNEEENIRPLLEDLDKLDYPGDLFEIILVDDHSVDRTPEILRSFCTDHPRFRFLEPDPAGTGKKAALEKGILAARNRIILNTDGDCRTPSAWARHMAAGFSDPETRMVAGAVIMEPDRGVFRAMQSLESFSLTAVGGGSAGLNRPALCSGASLAYYREDYLRFLAEHERVSESGDDVFLMLWLKKNFPRSVRFNAAAGSAVRTAPAGDLSAFFRQRMRWASKARYFRDTGTVASALLVLALNLLLLGLLLALPFFPVPVLPGEYSPDPPAGPVMLFGILFLGKSLADLLLLAPVLRHYGKSGLLLYFLPLQMIYFVYVSLTGVLGQILDLSWKGRKVRQIKGKGTFENKL